MRLAWVFGVGLAIAAVACGAPPAPPVPRGLEVNAHEHASAHEHEHQHEHEREGAGAAERGLVRIADPGHVCMLSNRFLGEKQHVPVEVEGKKYFGCCANCAARIGERSEARTAVDPVTGRTLDKASAVLARDETNKVFYFESEETLAQMRRAR